MDIYDLFSKFELELLPRDWVQDLWKNDFSEATEFPTEYEVYLENTDIGELMSTASNYIKEWLEETADPSNLSFQELNRPSTSSFHERSSLNTSQVDSKSWQNLIANNVQHKALVAVLSIYIQNGKTDKNFDVKRLGLIATDLYFMLLAISGSHVFHIYNPILYSHAVESLKICGILTSTASLAKKSAGKKRRGRQDDSSEDEDQENNSDGEEDLLPSYKVAVIKILNNVLRDLSFMLKKCNLKGQEDSLILTVQILILLTRLERNSSSHVLNSPPRNSVLYLSYMGYKILLELCCSDHGDIQETVIIIMREILPSLLIFDQKEVKLTPRETLVIKDHSVKFIHNLLIRLKDLAFQGVLTLVQNICVKIPDKVDLRAKGVQVVLDILNILPYTLYSHTIIWIMSLCHNDQIKNRVTGLEIITKLLCGAERVPSSPLRPFIIKNTVKNGTVHDNGNNEEEDDDDDDNNMLITQQPDFSTNKFLLGTIFSRCLDIASTVRAKALAILASLVSSNNRNIQLEMESIFVTPYLNADNIESNIVFEKGNFDFQIFLKNIHKESNADIDPLPGAKTVINFLQLFIEDEKVFVRKSALQVLVNIFLMNEKWMSTQLLEIMVNNCKDMSVLIRKLLVNCFTDLLLHYPGHPELPKYWVQGVMPLLADQEVKSQEKALEALQITILDKLVPYNQMKTSLDTLPWILLDLIMNYNKRQLFLFACHKWTLTDAVRQSLITTIKSHIETENNTAAWFLLACLSEYLDIKDPQFVLDYFYENVLNSQQVDEYCTQLVTEVMHLNWRQLPSVTQISLCDNLLRHLSQFTVPLPIIGRCMDICQLITEAHADTSQQARGSIKGWAANLISICESRLQKLIGPESPLVVEDEGRLCQYIFTVGEVSQVYPSQLSHSVLQLMQNLLMGDYDEEEEEFEEKQWKGKVGAPVQAVAVVTLGKLCLQKEETANVLVPLFGSLLSETSHPEIKINAMIALTDMCIKYTSLVENYLPDMCICLKDKELQVRENTLTLMIQLIQEDYLKLRCPVFFHILTTLLDEHQIIQDMTSSFIINSLLVKHKNILVQHFVEGLFHYNAYTGHSTYSKGKMMDAKEREVFSLEDSSKQEQRRHIYRFMLENMDDEERFKVTHRICIDILGGVAEDVIELSSSGMTLLQDALYVLSCDQIRLSPMQSGSKDNNDNNDDDEEGNHHVMDVFLRKKLTSLVVRKSMVDHIVPIFIKLKHKLKQLKSPLVRDLMACLRELMKDYKNQINEILAEDKELAAEIHHDLQNLDQQEDESSGDDGPVDTEMFKEIVLKAVALNASLNISKQGTKTPQVNVSTRLSTSHLLSQSGEKSTFPKINGQPSSWTLPFKSKTPSPGTNKKSPTTGTNRISPSSGSNKSSLSTDNNRISPKPGTSRMSPIPSTSRMSPIPGTSKMSPIPGTSRMSPIPGTSRMSPINGIPSSPSNSSLNSESSHSQGEVTAERKSFYNNSKSRTSTSLNSSIKSVQSQNRKKINKRKR